VGPWTFPWFDLEKHLRDLELNISPFSRVLEHYVSILEACYGHSVSLRELVEAFPGFYVLESFTMIDLSVLYNTSQLQVRQLVSHGGPLLQPAGLRLPSQTEKEWKLNPFLTRYLCRSGTNRPGWLDSLFSSHIAVSQRLLSVYFRDLRQVDVFYHF